jgi:hypothetical protein
MRLPVLLATALAAMLLLSSCAPSSTPDSRETSTPSPTVSMPAFLTSTQADGDALPDGIATPIDIGVTSTRYQGQWDGHDVYLGLRNDSSVCLVAGAGSDPANWVARCGTGNEVVTWTPPDGGIVKYLPITTSTTPQGWTRLSDYVFAM